MGLQLLSSFLLGYYSIFAVKSLTTKSFGFSEQHYTVFLSDIVEAYCQKPKPSSFNNSKRLETASKAFNPPYN